MFSRMLQILIVYSVLCLNGCVDTAEIGIANGYKESLILYIEYATGKKIDLRLEPCEVTFLRKPVGKTEKIKKLILNIATKNKNVEKVVVIGKDAAPKKGINWLYISPEETVFLSYDDMKNKMSDCK